MFNSKREEKTNFFDVYKDRCAIKIKCKAQYMGKQPEFDHS